VSSSSAWIDKLKHSRDAARTNWQAARERATRPEDIAPAKGRFDPTSWSGALILMVFAGAILWVIQAVNAGDDYRLNRFGLRPRHVDGLWGVVTAPFLHASWGHLLSNTVPFVMIGWIVLLAGVQAWFMVTGLVIVTSGIATWLVAPNGLIVGVSGLVFGWLGYLLARAYFSRSFKSILVAVVVLVFFGTLLAGLLPTVNSDVSWQGHVCGFAAGVLAGALLHPRKPRNQPTKRLRRGPAVS
jgi:membrane associated rhomboid family serine protease